jgi:uncharacterized protein (TIGR04255 family)
MPLQNPFPITKLPELKQPPIELIIGQVRVPMVVALLEPSGIAAFQKLAKADYPHIRREEQVAIRLSSEESPKSQSVGLWRLEDANHAWTVTVAPDFVALEAREYKDFGEFRDRLVTVAEWFRNAYDASLRVRVGLRYVDRFDAKKYPSLPANWIDKANPVLLTFVRMASGHEHRTFWEHRFSLGESWGMTFRASLGVASTEGAGDSELLLDVDAFNNEEADFTGLATILDSLKQIDYGAFAWASASLLDLLEKKP